MQVLEFPTVEPTGSGMGATPMMRVVNRYVDGRYARHEIQRNTANQTRSMLRGFATTFGEREVKTMGRNHVETWMASRGHLAPGTRRLGVATMRAFCTWMRQERIIGHDPMLHIKTPRVPRSAPRSLGRDEIDALYAALPDDRARALFTLMRGLGLRLKEAITIEVGDWDRRAQTLRVIGKGGHERIIPIPPKEAAVLSAYVAKTGTRAGVLIRRLDGSGGISKSRMSTLMRRWMETSGIKDAAYDGRGCHSLRHTLANEIIDVEPDIRVLQELLGHQNLSSTQIYVRRATITKVRAAMERAA